MKISVQICKERKRKKYITNTPNRIATDNCVREYIDILCIANDDDDDDTRIVCELRYGRE